MKRHYLMRNLAFCILVILLIASCQNHKDLTNVVEPISYGVDIKKVLKIVNESRSQGINCNSTLMSPVDTLEYSSLLSKKCYDFCAIRANSNNPSPIYTQAEISMFNKLSNSPGYVYGIPFTVLLMSKCKPDPKLYIEGFQTNTFQAGCLALMNSKYKYIGFAFYKDYGVIFISAEVF